MLLNTWSKLTHGLPSNMAVLHGASTANVGLILDGMGANECFTMNTPRNTRTIEKNEGFTMKTPKDPFKA